MEVVEVPQAFGLFLVLLHTVCADQQNGLKVFFDGILRAHVGQGYLFCHGILSRSGSLNRYGIHFLRNQDTAQNQRC